MFSLINLLDPDLWALLHSRNHHLLLLFLLDGLLLLDLSLMLIEVVLLTSKGPHGDHQVSESALELLPVLSVVEQLDGKGLHLGFVQVGEHFHDRRDQKLHDCLFVRWKGVGLAICHLDWLQDQVVLNELNELLENLGFELEA